MGSLEENSVAGHFRPPTGFVLTAAGLQIPTRILYQSEYDRHA